MKFLNAFQKKKDIALLIKYEEVPDVCSNLTESYRKRLYPAHFMSKLTDSDMENSETEVWLQFSYAAKYITNEELMSLQMKNAEVGKLLGYMIKNPEKYCR